LSEIICNTSPIQYLHQVQLLHILPELAARILVPPAVVDELREGRKKGIELPDITKLEWIEIIEPSSASALPLVTDLGPGETAVLALGLEVRNAVVVLDDAVARNVARAVGLKLTGTLGLLLDAKRKGIIDQVATVLDELQSLRFRLSAHTRTAVLKLAGEIK
jgi:predicted nucleic acid-binding protein